MNRKDESLDAVWEREWLAGNKAGYRCLNKWPSFRWRAAFVYEVPSGNFVQLNSSSRDVFLNQWTYLLWAQFELRDYHGYLKKSERSRSLKFFLFNELEWYRIALIPSENAQTNPLQWQEQSWKIYFRTLSPAGGQHYDSGCMISNFRSGGSLAVIMNYRIRHLIW